MPKAQKKKAAKRAPAKRAKSKPRPLADDQAIEFPKSPWWAAPYLGCIALGFTEQDACDATGIAVETPRKKRQRDSSFSRLHTRARRQGRKRSEVELIQAARERALKGDSWFWSRLMAKDAPELYKRIMAVINEADPRRAGVDVTGSSTKDELAALINAANAGGFGGAKLLDDGIPEADE